MFESLSTETWYKIAEYTKTVKTIAGGMIVFSLSQSTVLNHTVISYFELPNGIDSRPCPPILYGYSSTSRLKIDVAKTRLAEWRHAMLLLHS